MADRNPKFIGDLGLIQFENYISGVAGGVDNKASRKRVIKAAGLEGSSDPFEKMFSALSSHIENFGVTEEMERKLGSIPRNFKNIEDAPHLVQEYAKTVKAGKELHLASTKPVAPKASSLKVSKTSEPVPHRIRVGSYAGQFGSPSETNDARLRSTTGININHGWKIHADFAESLSADQAYSRMGRSATGEITDPKAAKSFDALLGKVGMPYEDFSKAFFFKTQTDGTNAGVKGLNNGQMQYIDPIATAKTMGIMEDLGMQYKLSAGNYGSGRHLTAYPQTLERRDQAISALEQGLGTSLQDQNDPAFRSSINAPTGIKNAPLSRGVSGRFTTDYLATKADGSPDFSIPGTETGDDPGLLVSGMVS